MQTLCRYDAFVVVTSQLEGGDYSVDICDNASTHVAIVRRAGDGLGVRVDVEVCAPHEQVISRSAGYLRSIKLRERTTT